nr:MAG: hypothetical protein H1RhizoLitter1834_000002 [Mitovirus sp.]
MGVWNRSSDKVLLLLGFGPLRRDPAALEIHWVLRKLKVRKCFSPTKINFLCKPMYPVILVMMGSRFGKGRSTLV